MAWNRIPWLTDVAEKPIRRARRLARFGRWFLSMSIVACSSSDGVDRAAEPAPAQTPPTSQSGRRAGVTSDPERYARAFRNGLVGQTKAAARSLLEAEVVATARSSGCHLPPGEPCDPPPPTASISVRPLATDIVGIAYTCGDGANTIVRTQPNRATIPTDCTKATTADTGLMPGTRYCYALAKADGSLGTGEYCTSTLFSPYLFNGPGITQDESDQMAASFDWTHTDPVLTTVDTAYGTVPALYSMLILMHNGDDLTNLRFLGIHTQTEPLLGDEKAAWDGTVLQAMSNDSPVGVWMTAIVPGAEYNDLRSQAIAGIATGHPIGIKAMVFRRINVSAAAFYPNLTVVPVSPLDPVYLAQQGLQYNGTDPPPTQAQCDADGTCTIQQQLGLGWLISQIITYVTDIVHDVVTGIRELFGKIETVIRGDMTVTIHIDLTNSDPLFGGNDQLARSAWNVGAPLVLKNLPVRVYQGHFAMFTDRTDDNGTVTMEVAHNLDGRVCVLLDNDVATIVDTYFPREYCIGTFEANQTQVMLSTNNGYANDLAAITDAADYLLTVMRFHMDKISVLTGLQARILTANGRSFTPCLGRLPNIMVDLGTIANNAAGGGAAGLAAHLLTLLTELGEFFTAYDVILAQDDAESRGVIVHEYGHAAMCQLLGRVGYRDASTAWADLMMAEAWGQDPASQVEVIAEAFADFIALQVVGGTNYVSGRNAKASPR